MALNDHVRITVRRVRSVASQAGFGTLMALDAHRLWEDRYRSFASIAELEAAGASSNDTIHRLATSYFAQSPAPQALGVGRRDVADTVYCEVDSANSERAYELTVGGLLFRITSAPDATAELIAGKLVTELNGGYRITDIGAGAGGTFTLAGNHADEFTAGQTFTVRGSTNNNANWTVASVSLDTTPGSTVITVIGTQTVGAVADGHIGGYAILGVSIANRTFTVPGDVRSRFPAGLEFGVDGSTGNDNRSGSGTAAAGLAYVVASTALTSGNTVITISATEGAGAIPNATVDGGVVAWADGATAVSIVQADVLDFALTAVAAGAGGTFTFAGDHRSLFPAGAAFRITGQTAANAGAWTVGSVALVAGATVITVVATQTVAADAATLGSISLPIVEIAPEDASQFYTVAADDNLRLRFGITNAANTDLTTIRNANDNWYAVALTSRFVDDVMALALAVEAISDSPKLFLAGSGDEDIIDQTAAADSGVTGSIASRMAALNYARSGAIFSGDDAGFHDTASIEHTDYQGFSVDENDDDPFIEAAIWGKMLPTNPGASTFNLQELVGIIADDLTTTQRDNALAKFANIYATITSTADGFQGATVAANEWIDVMWGLDWWRNDAETRVFNRLWSESNAGRKVPMTDKGAAIIEAELRASVELAISRGVLTDDPAPTFTTPLIASLSAGDRAARTLSGVQVRATMAGAIHEVEVTLEAEVA